MPSLRYLFVVPILALISVSASAVTVHVPADQASIQAGIEASSPGDTVLIACGTYFEYDIVVAAGISLLGGGADATGVVIDAQHQGRVMFCDELVAETTIRNLTLTGGVAVGSESAGWGGGLFCTASNLIVSDLVLVGNQAITGGGMWIANCHPPVDNVEFISNVANYGGGLRVSGYGSVPVLSHCLFRDNIATVSGGGMYTSSSTPQIISSTFCGNSAWSGGSAIHSCNRETTIENSVLAFGAGESAVVCDIGGSATLTCCNVFGNGADWDGCIAGQHGVSGNISQDPMFCDLANGDLTIDEGSPCAPENNECAEFIGALGIGCHETPVHAVSWGTIKSLYR